MDLVRPRLTLFFGAHFVTESKNWCDCVFFSIAGGPSPTGKGPRGG